MPALPRLLLASLAAALSSGCSFEAFTYTVDQYGGVQGAAVKLGCQGSYEVFDRPEKRSMLVATNPVAEIAAASCGTAPGLSLPERQRQVAEIYLREDTDRPLCRITRETAVTERHREFAYSCPAGETGPATAARPADPGPLFGRKSVEGRTRR